MCVRIHCTIVAKWKRIFIPVSSIYHCFRAIIFRNSRCLNKNICPVDNTDTSRRMNEKYIPTWKRRLSWFDFNLKFFSFDPKFIALNETPDFHFHGNEEAKSYIWPQYIFSHILAHKLIVRSFNKSSNILRQKSIILSTWLTYVKYFLTVTNQTICADTTSCELLTWEKNFFPLSRVEKSIFSIKG